MKTQTNQRQQTILLATIATIFLLGTSVLTFAQGKFNKIYRTRDPRPCVKKSSPGKMPTAAEAEASVICNGEGERGNTSLYLYEDVKVTQIGKGSPYKPGVDFNVDDLDPKFLIYPIRGSFKKYQCSKPDPASDGGKSCRLYDEANAQGRCYKDTFSQWQCSMDDKTVGFNDYTEVAPPGNANAATVKDKPNAANDNKQIAAKTDAAENRDENGFPKPDFSALEKWYQISRYEYKPIEKKLYIYFKTDVPYRERPSVFKMEYRNKDGMLMLDTTLSWMMEFSNAEVGEPTKGYVNMPSEKTMQDVVSVKAVRVVE